MLFFDIYFTSAYHNTQRLCLDVTNVLSYKNVLIAKLCYALVGVEVRGQQKTREHFYS